MPLLARTLLIVASLAALGGHCEAKPPNVVIVLTDDQGWGDLSHSGNSNLSTPRVDSLAKDGASFERFYVQPVCSPTRAELLTGRYHPRCGVYSTSAGGERLDLDESTIAETFKAAGYHTAAFGKWHNGMQPPYHPNARGFDEYYGFCSGHWGNYFDPALEHNGRLVQGNGYCVDDFTRHALDFMEKHADDSFFVYLPYNIPHAPMQVPDRFWDEFKSRPIKMRNRDAKKEDVDFTRAALAMCENVDWNVGRILDKLDELELAEETIVVYFCDNGPNSWRWNGDMKGRKGSTDEGGVRSPLFVRWKGHVPAGRVIKSEAAAIDLRPTLAAMCGIPVKATKPLDGVDLSNWLTAPRGQTKSMPVRPIFAHWRGRVSVRSQDWVLDHEGKLYNLAEDPGQRTDVAEKHAQYAKELGEYATWYRKEVLGELKKDSRSFPVGHADFDFTQLPARDATATGGIERSNKFPNCSYFRNWTSTDETISFDAEVLTAGDYDVELHYACPAKDVGSAIELSFGNSKLTGKITEAHDPPIRGAENDRVKRPESYVKAWKPLKLGTIHLEPGRGPLVLRATSMPGDQVMEFRLLYLVRREG